MTTECKHILVVDDDTRLRGLLRRYLSENGFRVTTAHDAAEAREKLRSLTFDLIVLDVMMPGESGIELTDSLRKEDNLPILLLTAMGEADDRIKGLEAGADDYLPKPFEPRELVLRIQTILRRAPQEEAAAEIHLGDCSFDLAREELRRGGELVRLTGVEASLLATLAKHAGTALSREKLVEESRIRGSARTVDVQVTRLRRKIEPDPKFPRYLQTVHGQGYVLRPDR
ncbi:MAG: response regulator [Alphaproteobacteria bacterium]|nr:response regulator [Alphaproteobacteria bacterium]